MKVAFIGLGVMGFPMAGHMARAGYDVTVFNRTREKALAWVKEYEGKIAQTPKEAAQDAEVVFSCVGNDEDLKSVTLGPEGAFAGMKKGSIYCDHTTVSAKVTRALFEEAAKLGLHFMDAPVSGGQAGAQKGVLTIFCGGEKSVFESLQSLLCAYGQKMTYFGDSGAGQLTKMVNQICIAGCIEGVSEAMAFGLNAGLPMDEVIDAVGGGAASSWQLVNRGKTMVRDEFDFGFAIDWMRKDLGIALEEAKCNGSSLPVTALVDQFYGELQAKGASRQDTSALIMRLHYKKVTK